MSFLSRIRDRIVSLFGKGAACARFCEQLYPAGPDRSQCVRNGAGHVSGNLCDACESEFSRFCTGPTGTHVCCKPLQVCDRHRGVCV